MPSSSRSSTVPTKTTSEGFAELEPEWRALHERVPGATPFASPAFLSTWLEAFGEGVAPVFLAVRADEELVGVTPLAPERGRVRQLGDPNVFDYTTILAAPGEEARVAGGLFEWLREDMTPVVEVWGIPEASSLAVGLETEAKRSGWRMESAVEATCPGLGLAATWDEYLAGLSKHDRHELQRKLRHLHEAGEVRFTSTPASEDGAGVERLLRQMRASRPGKDEFLTPAMEQFFRAVAARMPGAKVGTLSLDGVPVATLFMFERDGEVLLYNSGYELSADHLAIGLLSKAEAIRDAIARGMRRFDFLRGAEEYKRHLGGQPKTVLTMTFRDPTA